MLGERKIVKEFEYGIVASLSAAVEFVSLFLRKLERNLVEEKKRNEVRTLLKLDDHQLRDMGITRDDVKAALMQPMDRNSGAALSVARRSRGIKYT